GLSRATSFDSRTDQRWIAVSSRRDARRSRGVGDVDELEMCADWLALRRREGWDFLRSTKTFPRRIGTTDASIYAGDDSVHRRKGRCDGTGHGDERTGDGVDDGYVFGAHGLYGAGDRDGKTGGFGRIVGTT